MATICASTGRGKTEEAFELLRDVGPMSAKELCELTGRNRGRVFDTLTILKKAKRIYIQRYERQEDGKAGRCIPVYAIGDLPDVRALAQLPAKVRDRKYRQRNHAKLLAKERAMRASRRGESLNIWRGLL